MAPTPRVHSQSPLVTMEQTGAMTELEAPHETKPPLRFSGPVPFANTWSSSVPLTPKQSLATSPLFGYVNGLPSGERIGDVLLLRGAAIHERAA